MSSETILVSAVYIANIERNHISFCCLHYESRAKPYWFLLSTLRMSSETILVSAVYITNVARNHIGFCCLHYECRPFWFLLSTLRKCRPYWFLLSTLRMSTILVSAVYITNVDHIGFYCLDYKCRAKPRWFLLLFHRFHNKKFNVRIFDNSIKVC